MKKAFRKIAKAISITTTILLSSVFLAFSAFAEGGGIGDAPSSVNTATYKTLVTLVFWVVRIVVLGLTAIPGLIKIAQGVGNEDVRERNGGISLLVIGGALFAAKMGGGSVNPLTGEFNFSVLEGYWVKNGKIHCPVRGAALIGRGAEVLMKIDRVGMNMWFGHGMCGSRSGSVPTNVGQPRIRVSGITVGGKGGRL